MTLRIKMHTLVQIGVKLVSIGLQKCTKCMIHKHKDDLKMYIKVCVKFGVLTNVCLNPHTDIKQLY